MNSIARASWGSCSFSTYSPRRSIISFLTDFFLYESKSTLFRVFLLAISSSSLLRSGLYIISGKLLPFSGSFIYSDSCAYFSVELSRMEGRSSLLRISAVMTPVSTTCCCGGCVITWNLYTLVFLALNWNLLLSSNGVLSWIGKPLFRVLLA